MKRIHFVNFEIAGFSYWDGAMVFNELKIGTQLRIEREEDNKYDPKAVAIYYGDSKLGFVPRSYNSELSKLCEAGYSSIFDIRVNKVSPEEEPENQIGVIICIIKKEV